MSVPQSWRRLMYWCEHLFERFGTYRMAMERIISYFLTDIQIGGDKVSDEVQEKYKKFFSEALDILGGLGFESTELIINSRQDLTGLWTDATIDRVRARLEKRGEATSAAAWASLGMFR